MVSKIRTSNKNKTDSELTDTLLSKSNKANSIKDNSEKHNQTVNKSKLDIIDELSSNEYVKDIEKSDMKINYTILKKKY